MQAKYIVIGLLLVFGCPIYAMDDEREKDLIKKIDLGSLGLLQDYGRVHDAAFTDRETLAFVGHIHDGSKCMSRFSKIDIDDGASLVDFETVPSLVSASKITSGGNFLYGCMDGRVGFYLPRTDQAKILSTCASSKIVALANNVAIKGHDNRLHKTIAAVAANGNLHCIADDTKNSQCMSLVKAFARRENRSDYEIIAADIHSYTSKRGILPFVAFALRYYNSNLNQGKYAHKVMVYNPLCNEVCVFSGHSGFVRDIHFLPDNTVCTASNDGSIGLWDPIKKRKLYVVKCCNEGDVRLQTNVFFQFEQHFNEHVVELGDTMVSCVTPSPCGRYLASIDGLGDFALWDVETGACLHGRVPMMPRVEAPSAKVVFSPDSTRLCISSFLYQWIYDVTSLVKKPINFSDEERNNGIKTFLRRQKGSGTLEAALMNRQLGR